MMNSQLLGTFAEGIDDNTDGVLLHGDNYQVLNLIAEKYRAKVKCVYIDPPYNTSEESFQTISVFESNPAGRSIDTFFATCHDYVVVYGKDAQNVAIQNRKLNSEQIAAFNLKDSISKYRLLSFRRSGGLSTPATPNSHYPIFYDETTGKIDITPFDGA